MTSRAEHSASTAALFVKDSLMESASEEQRSKGIIPTVADNESYLLSVLGTFGGKGETQPDHPPL